MLKLTFSSSLADSSQGTQGSWLLCKSEGFAPESLPQFSSLTPIPVLAFSSPSFSSNFSNWSTLWIALCLYLNYPLLSMELDPFYRYSIAPIISSNTLKKLITMLILLSSSRNMQALQGQFFLLVSSSDMSQPLRIGLTFYMYSILITIELLSSTTVKY